MLLNQSPLSKIGTVFLSSDATTNGTWTYAELSDWSSAGKKANSVQFSLDGTPYVSTVPLGVKGPRTLSIPSCTSTLYAALRALTPATHYTAVLYHPTATLSWDVQVIAVTSPVDDQWASGDPVKDLTVRFVVHSTV